MTTSAEAGPHGSSLQQSRFHGCTKHVLQRLMWLMSSELTWHRPAGSSSVSWPVDVSRSLIIRYDTIERV